MLKKIDHNAMGKGSNDWLKSVFHFSFADYYNPDNMQYGVLRVLNDDLISPKTGFGTHPHNDMEIISYVVKGELTHGDSMDNRSKLYRGHVQYMSAGTGITHSEVNDGDPILRILQMWIVPDKKGYSPDYGEYRFEWPARKNNWLHIFSSKAGTAPIKINQDANCYIVDLDKKKKLEFVVEAGRQAYLVQIEGSSQVNGISLNQRDALEIIEENIIVKSTGLCHCMIIEMKKAAD